MSKKILIIDEAGFSRVCSAIFEIEGLKAEVVDASAPSGAFEWDGFDLVITSYPYGTSLFTELRKRRGPTMVLSDHFNENLLEALDSFEKVHCMIKPIDYQRFIALVKSVVNGDASIPGGLRIV
ncbi:MAG TPA: DNA-binding response regulator [Thermodesulfobacteriota bacterium]